MEEFKKEDLFTLEEAAKWCGLTKMRCTCVISEVRSDRWICARIACISHVRPLMSSAHTTARLIRRCDEDVCFDASDMVRVGACSFDGPWKACVLWGLFCVWVYRWSAITKHVQVFVRAADVRHGEEWSSGGQREGGEVGRTCQGEWAPRWTTET